MDFYGAGEDNGGRGTDAPGGRHPNRTSGAPSPQPPRFFTGRMPLPVSVIKASCAKMAQWIDILFGVETLSLVLQRNIVLDVVMLQIGIFFIWPEPNSGRIAESAVSK